MKELFLSVEIDKEINSIYPVDLSFDQQNNLYVVDSLNDRVQKFELI
jgi:hypothetical protein